MKIAIDVMGGDYAPDAAIDGAISFIKKNPEINISIILLGLEKNINSYLNTLSLNNYILKQISIIHCPQIVTMDDRPSRILRDKPNSSLIKAIELVKNKEADAIISAGNTGALLISSLLLLGKIKGIRRPAFAPFIPTIAGGFIICDAGANVDAKPKHLLQFALMASAYIEHLKNIKKVKVGLLNIGKEENKGNDLYKEGYKLLKENLNNFYGNIEARYIQDGLVDVVVCDGFTGNIILKHSEGMIKHILLWIKELNKKTNNNTNINKTIKTISALLDYEEHGATPLLGVDGVVMKCHGSSKSKGFYSSIEAAKKAFDHQLINDIESILKKHTESILNN